MHQQVLQRETIRPQTARTRKNKSGYKHPSSNTKGTSTTITTSYSNPDELGVFLDETPGVQTPLLVTYMADFHRRLITSNLL